MRLHQRCFRLFLASAVVVILSKQGLFSQVYPFTDPHNEGEWLLLPDVSDEFEGNRIDLDKWIIQGSGGQYQNGFKGRAPSQFTPGNVSIGDGFFTITSKWDPTFSFVNDSLDGYRYGEFAPITTGAIITKARFLYGYMEIRCKVADGPISSAFWTTGTGGELDVFEHYGHHPTKENIGKKYHTSFHDWRIGSETWGKRIWTNEHILDFRVAEDFHIYGLEWDEDYIKIYADGRLVRCVTREEIGEAWVLSNPQKVWLDCETFNWHVKPENMQPDDFPGEGRKYIVDYVRLWQREKTGPGCVPMENLVVNPGFENGLDDWTKTGSAIPVSDLPYEGSGAVKLNGLGAIQQVVQVKPQTVYVVSARIRMPGTNMQNIWHNAQLGVNGYGGDETSVQYFRPEYTYQSIQFTTGESDSTATIFFRNSNAAHLAYADQFSLVEARDLHEQPIVYVQGVDLVQDSIFLDTGDTITLSALIYPEHADDKKVEWHSADTTVVKVRGEGVVEAIGAGITTVSATTRDGGYSDSCVAIVSGATGIQNSGSAAFYIYPNPASDLLHVSAPFARKVVISNMAGVQLLKSCKTEEPLLLQVSQLPPGIYFLTILSDEFSGTEKLLIR